MSTKEANGVFDAVLYTKLARAQSLKDQLILLCESHNEPVSQQPTSPERCALQGQKVQQLRQRTPEETRKAVGTYLDNLLNDARQLTADMPMTPAELKEMEGFFRLEDAGDTLLQVYSNLVQIQRHHNHVYLEQLGEYQNAQARHRHRPAAQRLLEGVVGFFNPRSSSPCQERERSHSTAQGTRSGKGTCV